MVSYVCANMHSMHESYVYIVTNKRNSTLYIGVTSNLAHRIYQHKNGVVDSFTSKYKLNKLVYYEAHGDIYAAITREKSTKRWLRKWKIAAIEKDNKNWRDLYFNLIG